MQESKLKVTIVTLLTLKGQKKNQIYPVPLNSSFITGFLKFILSSTGMPVSHLQPQPQTLVPHDQDLQYRQGLHQVSNYHRAHDNRNQPMHRRKRRRREVEEENGDSVAEIM